MTGIVVYKPENSSCNDEINKQEWDRTYFTLGYSDEILAETTDRNSVRDNECNTLYDKLHTQSADKCRYIQVGNYNTINKAEY